MPHRPESASIPLGSFEITVATDAGPRILGYRRKGGVSAFAELPDAAVALGDGRKYRFLGGHRLWRAPETPLITYEPDDHPIQLDDTGGEIEITGLRDRNGIAKRITVTQRGEYTIVDHALENRGEDTVLTAPWAITQFRPGGFAFVPTAAPAVDQAGVSPNRSIVLWPYTDLSASEVQFTSTSVMIHASPRPGKMKLGLANRAGWLAYLLGDDLFVKWSHLHVDQGFYVDLGASVQCYRDERFLELETLGTRAQLTKGERITHREVWTIIPLGGKPPDETLLRLPAAPEGVVL
jgi:hypothetical protein